MPAATACRPQPSWYVYIVRCLDETFYTGITTDMKRRLAEHNAGSGAKYTRSRRPVFLVYCEAAVSRSAAAKRECQIKRLSPAAKKHLVKTTTTPTGDAGQAAGDPRDFAQSGK